MIISDRNVILNNKLRQCGGGEKTSHIYYISTHIPGYPGNIVNRTNNEETVDDKTLVKVSRYIRTT